MANQPKLAGDLVVVALKARDLPNREIVGKQDPFCIFRLGETAKRTKTDYRGGQHPVWDDQVTVPVPRGKTKMYIQVFDEDASREDLISEGDLDLSTVLQDGEQDGWFPLKYRGKPAGQIYLELTFYSAQPPPKRQPTRFGNKRTSYKQHGYYQSQPPQVPSGPPPLPQATSQPPARPSAGPPVYQPPPPNHQQEQAARPHMPPPVTPSTSSGTPSSAGSGYPPSNRLSPQYPYQPQPGYPPQHGHPPHHQNHPPSQQGYPQQPGYPPQNGYLPQQAYPPQHGFVHQQSPQPQIYQPMTSASPPPPPATSQQGDAPLLASTFRPQHPPTPAPQHGGQPRMGFGIPPPAAAGYPPQNGTPGSTFAFPEPLPYHGGYTPYNNPNGQPFAAHQSQYPSPVAGGGYLPPPAGVNPNGYPPAAPGYPQYGGYQQQQQQQQQQQPSYPPY